MTTPLSETENNRKIMDTENSMSRAVAFNILLNRREDRFESIIHELAQLVNYQFDIVVPIMLTDPATNLGEIKDRVMLRVLNLTPWIESKLLPQNSEKHAKQASFDAIRTTVLDVFTYTTRTFQLVCARYDASDDLTKPGHYSQPSEYDSYIDHYI